MELWDRAKPIGFERSVSRSTISRVLNRSGIHSYRATRKPMLTRRHRLSRQKFTKEHSGIDWKCVIFSNEKRYPLRPGGSKRVWRRKGERYTHKCVSPTVKFGGGSVMVWIAIRSDGRIWLRRCSDHMNSKEYLNMLRRFFSLSSIKSTIVRKGCYFQQDGATVHTTKHVLGFLNSTGTKTLPWPAQSPDLNIVEHVWPMITCLLGKRSFSKKNELWDAIKNACKKLQRSRKIRNLYDSIPRRLEACRQSRGSHISYCFVCSFLFWIVKKKGCIYFARDCIFKKKKKRKKNISSLNVRRHRRRRG